MRNVSCHEERRNDGTDASIHRRSIDVENGLDLKRLVDEVQASGEPVVLRQNGEEAAVVLPPRHADGAEVATRPRLSEAERQAFLATAGGWEGLIDVDEFIANNHESKRVSARPPVHLE